MAPAGRGLQRLIADCRLLTAPRKESRMAELMTDGVRQGRAASAGGDAGLDTEFRRGLGPFDATMVVVGSMIGSGIFLVSADMARLIGAPGWLLVAWVVTGVLTVAAAL